MRGAPHPRQDKGREFLEAAIRYARRGFRVLPLRERSKVPLIKDWPNKATTDEATIRAWWEKWPTANIGIATGRYRDGYFCVVDFDPDNGGNWYDDVGEDILPPTWVVHTGGGGRHYYYRTREPLRCAKLMPGVDLKGEGGYVVAPPSIHPEGTEYGWELGSTPKEVEMAEVPKWVLDKVRGGGDGAHAVSSGDGVSLSLWRMRPKIPKGMRHNYLVSLAGALWAAGVSEKEIEAVLWGALELFETREDFDPVAEIGGIIKGLHRWEGDSLSLGVLLRSLPEEVAAIVRREVKSVAIASEPVTNGGVAFGGEKATAADADGQGSDAAGATGQSGGKRKAKEKKGRKSKTVDSEEIMAVLERYKWLKWQGALWQASKHKLFRADLDRLHGLLKQNGVEVGKETLKSYLADILSSLPKDPLDGLVVTPEPTYGKVGGIYGLWFSHRGSLYVVTPNEVRVFPEWQWPEGAYTLDAGEAGVLPNWDGDVKHLLAYWEGIMLRFSGDAKVALAMFLPVLFGQGHIGLILRGPATSGKSTLRNALGYLRLGRKPGTPNGHNMRDFMAVLHRERIVFFDEVNTFSDELQEVLKRMITHDKMIMRALYTDLERVEAELEGTAVFCTTKLEKLASDLRTRCFVWDLEPKGGSDSEEDILRFCAKLWPYALGGAIKLYQQAAKLKRPPRDFMPEIRFRDWLSWAYRYAQVLGVENEFVAYVRKSKQAAHRGDRFEFLIDALSHPDFDPQKEYTIGELFELAGPTSNAAKGLPHALNSEGVRSDLIALALDMGYRLRIEKKREKGEKKERYKFIFQPLQGGVSDRLRGLLQSVGLEPDWEADWEGGWDEAGAPPAEPQPENGHPEVHTPIPAPEPEPMAAQSTIEAPTPPAPETPMAIAVQSAATPDPSLPTPEENERGMAELREALARLPKPGGLLQQRGSPIEGWVHALAPRELTEYLRARAWALATEAVRAAEKGSFGEAAWLWGSAALELADLTAFDPTREVIAAVFLARAAFSALLATRDPALATPAMLIAKAAEMVFFGKADPRTLLGALLEPTPPKPDPCIVGHYRLAAEYLRAAHGVLTGSDPKPLMGWIWPRRNRAA